MASAGNTPIQLYYSNTAGNAPLDANLISGELAINMADGLLYFKDSTNAVSILASRNTASGANAAFIQANAAFLRANSAYAQANGASIYANGAFTQANGTSIYANGAFAQANASFITANAATVNVSSAAVYANGAFIAANAATVNVSSAAIYANGAFAQANAAYASDNVTGIYANTAFAYANSAGSYANSAFGVANNALPKSGGTITGSLTVSQDVTVQGNLAVLGTTTSINTSSFVVNDSLLVLGLGNYTSDLLDIGFASHYNNGVNAHTGLIRDSVSKEWIFFEGYTPEVSPNNNIDITDSSFRYANVYANTVKANVIANTIYISGYNVFTYITNAYTQANSAYSSQNTTGSYANSAFLQANSAYGSQNVTGSYANSAYYTANSAQTYANGAFSYANSSYTLANTSLARDSWIANTVITANSTGTLGNSGMTYNRDTSTLTLGFTGPVGNLTIGTTTALAPITINKTYTTVTAGEQYGYYGTTNYNIADGSLKQGLRLNTAANHTTGIMTNTIGVLSLMQAGGVGGVTSSTMGFWARNDVVVGSYVTNAYNFVSNDGGNTGGANTQFGFYTTNLTKGLINNFGFYGSVAPSSPTSNGAYNLYMSGLAPNYFAGSLTIANNVPSTSVSSGGLIVNGGMGVSGNVYSGAHYIVGAGNGITFPDGTSQNTSPAATASYANSAFLQANSAYGSQNVTGTYANSAYYTANSAQLYANGAFVQANSAYGSQNTTGSYANSAFAFANSAGSYANSAFAVANSGSSYANSGFAVANSASIYANGAFTTANSALPKAGGTITGNLVLSGINTNITFPDGTKQNTAITYIAINNLFERKTYIATAGQTGFNIRYTPDPSGNNVFLHINGIYIDPTEFTALTGTSILLTTPAFAGDVVDIVGYTILGTSVNNQIMMTSVPTINIQYGTSSDYTDIKLVALAQSFIV